MLSIKRGAGTPADDARPRRKRPSSAFLISLGANALIIGAFFRAVLEGYTWADLVGHRPVARPAERITFVAPGPPTGPSTPGRSGGDGLPVTTPHARSRPLVAPQAVPSVVPPVAKGAPTGPVGGTGPVVGGGGTGEGIQPTYRDPGLWTRPGSLATAPKTEKQRVDSVLTQTFGAARDSILALQEAQAKQRKPGDWTFKGPGGTWGMDDHSIHLGKIAIPNAVLALLSSKFQQNLRGNPVAAVEARRLGDMRRDVLDHAQASMNEDDFRGAVKAIRARKDRERNERLAEQRRAAELAAEESASNANAAQPQR